MGKYIHLFETNAEFQAMYNDGEKYIEPWTSYTRENGSCGYNKKSGPLKMTFHEATNITFTNLGVDYSLVMVSKNGGEWVSATNYSGTSLSIVSGDTLEFKGDYDTYLPYAIVPGASEEQYHDRVVMNTEYIEAGDESHWPKVTLEGNIMSLIDSENYSGLKAFTQPYVFAGGVTRSTTEGFGLFRKISIRDMSNLELPATGLTEGCYHYLFKRVLDERHPSGDSSILCFDEFLTAPVLPATTLATKCYLGMFKECYSLEIAPVLSAQTLVSDCYYTMFAGCMNLHDVTILATSLDSSLSSLSECCMHMLWGSDNSEYAGYSYVYKIFYDTGEKVQCTFNCPNQTILNEFNTNYSSIGGTIELNTAYRIWNIPE